MKLFFEDNNKIKDKKLFQNLIIVAIICVVFIIVASSFKDSTATTSKKLSNENAQNRKEYDGYEMATKNELKSVLEQIEGVGKVDVMISFANGEEQVPAINENDAKNSTEEKDNEGGNRNTTQINNGSTIVMSSIDGKSQPFIVKTLKPKVVGVIVVAEGAENSITSLSITNAVMNIFNLTPDKVNVLPMKK